MVGHSFRVMAMAKNFDELVVGMMHAIYAGSDYTRFLYRVDVDGDPEWKAALDLFHLKICWEPICRNLFWMTRRRGRTG